MKISDSMLEYYGNKFVKDGLLESEGITFLQYLYRELQDAS